MWNPFKRKDPYLDITGPVKEEDIASLAADFKKAQELLKPGDTVDFYYVCPALAKQIRRVSTEVKPGEYASEVYEGPWGAPVHVNKYLPEGISLVAYLRDGRAIILSDDGQVRTLAEKAFYPRVALNRDRGPRVEDEEGEVRE